MEKLISFIKNNAKELFNDIKIVNIIFNKTTNSLVVKVVYRADYDFSEQDKEKISSLIKTYLSIKDLKVEIKSKKSLVDNLSVMELVKYYVNKNYESIFAASENEDIKININGDIVDINVLILPVFKNFLDNKHFANELKEFLESYYFQKFNVQLNEKREDDNLSSILDEQTKVFEDMVLDGVSELTPKTITLNNVEQFAGGKVEDIAIAISSISNDAVGITISGELNFITKKSFVSKRKGSEGEEKIYYNFVLNDGYDKINCVYFPLKDDVGKFDELVEKAQIAVCGDVEEFNGHINFKVKGIAKCVLPEKQVQAVAKKGVNKEYKFVTPEPYINLSQATFFDVVVENKNKFLKENDCVVFDLETTGLDATTCEIIEIGACKVVDGKITERFSTLVKPKEQIPDEITNLTGISNEMVANAYSIRDVLQDFYKFTRNSVLVAYNIAFDYKFLYMAGQAQGYDFDNPQMDAMIMAKQKLKGLKNYKLKTVVEKLNCVLENAHRAVNDATATADVFIKLCDDDTRIE